jgi:hypothetical protein
MKILIIVLSIFSVFQHSSDKTIVGTWITMEDNTKIQIEEEKGMLIGKIKSSDNPNAQVGKLILKDLVKSGNTWTGKIFAVKRKEWIDVEITSDNNSLNLKIQYGIVTRNLIWKRL